MDDLVKSSSKEIKKFLGDKDNKHALVAGSLAYYLSNDHKQRNAVIAGVLAYALLGNKNDEDDEDGEEEN